MIKDFETNPDFMIQGLSNSSQPENNNQKRSFTAEINHKRFNSQIPK